MKKQPPKSEDPNGKTDTAALCSRRALLKYSAFSSASWALGGLTARRVQSAQVTSMIRQPVVRTTSGRVRGSAVRCVNIFKGIPYGASTAGENRFMPPRKPTPWAGVRDARHYGPIAVQQIPIEPTYKQLCAGLFPKPPYEMSEDCLVLNIWSPELGKQSKRPVMVWLHPGGTYHGGGSADWCDGVNLACKHEVVTVSLNHRLNVFGYLYLGDIGGPKYAESGNVGMLDIVAALRWVNDNIAEFGGDPDNVTVFGESGGGQKVSVLMAMPPAIGLFHKAIVQGGSWNQAIPREEASIITADVFARLKLRPGELDELHQLSSHAVFKAMGNGLFAPVVAGASLPRHPFHPDAPTISAHVPMLIGTNKDEGTYSILATNPPPRVFDETTLTHALVNSFSWEGIDQAMAKRYIDAYRAVHPAASPGESFVGIVTARMLADASLQAERKAEQEGAHAYMYLFTWESPAFGGEYGSSHTFDVPFVFDNIDAERQLWGPDPDPRRYLLAANMSKAWAAFAHTGNPGHPALPEWRPYTMAERATMLLNYSCKLVNDPQRDDRLAFEPLRSRIQSFHNLAYLQSKP